MTQKTIKKDAEEYYNNNIFCDGITEFEHDIAIRCYIAGAKDQAERMYSEEEMIDFAFNTYYYISGIMNVPFNKISENKIHAIDNFEQFKKKIK